MIRRDQESVIMAAVVKSPAFRDAVCRKFGCTPGTYAETVFQHCLYPHAAWPVRLIQRLHPNYFDLDFELLDLIATCTEPQQLRSLVDSHRYHHPPQSLLQGFLRIRLSGQRVINLGGRLLGQQPLRATPTFKMREGASTTSSP
jgi:hypothetical protein